MHGTDGCIARDRDWRDYPETGSKMLLSTYGLTHNHSSPLCPSIRTFCCETEFSRKEAQEW